MSALKKALLEVAVEQAMALSCDDQLKLVQRVAANIGYVVKPEPPFVDDDDPKGVLTRLDRLEAAVRELNPGLNI